MQEGYIMKIKYIHVITTSKTTDTLITILKQILSAKLIERIQLHTNYESVYKFVSKNFLPLELGGYERSLSELHELWLDVLCSEKHQEYFKERRSLKTNEKFRQTDKLNEEYMGIPGTFRTLSLD